VIGAADQRIRLAVFDWLTDQREEHGEALQRKSLESFRLKGVHIPLVGASGIWKPRVCELPISATHIPSGPYSDTDSFDTVAGTLRYAYMGTDPQHPDNRGLRRMMVERVPIVYFHRIVKGQYVAAYPGFVVGDDPVGLVFTMQFDDPLQVEAGVADFSQVAEDASEPRRAYVTATVRRRVHQAAFRDRVIRAYRESCALCRLGHLELLDAAHITPDSHLAGDPVVSNGLALCKLHHAAFDKYFFAVRPDYTVEVRRSILDEADGPMLVVGLQQIHGQRIYLPRRAVDWPSRDRLAQRFDLFLEAS